jgi:hypothetical protein
MRFLMFAVPAFLTALAACSTSSTPKRDVRTYPAGEKATVGHLTYTIIDTEAQPRLGDDSSPRVPQNRFYLVQLSVSNNASSELNIPSLSLLDDSGNVYPELSDGNGVPHWLGMIRKVDAGQTEQGYVAFDAPTSHYRLKLSDETSDNDIYADIPLSFVHERMTDAGAPVLESAAPPLFDKSAAGASTFRQERGRRREPERQIAKEVESGSVAGRSRISRRDREVARL